jgi:class 3 adenylate cyclase
MIPPDELLQIQSIQKLLANDFSSSDENAAISNSEFAELIVSHLLDAVMFVSTDLIVLSSNYAVQGVLGLDPHTILGKHLSELFTVPDDLEVHVTNFMGLVDGAMRGFRTPNIEAEVTILRDDTPAILSISVLAITQGGWVETKLTTAEALSILALVITDISSTMASKQLLLQERETNSRLLSSILPDIIVNKLQNGERDISFQVSSASIMFVDIVSFTPWCGSHDAAYVMKILNRLFLEFDCILKPFDRLMKIKCIGDCYMCAGGIFDTVNQPKIHASQIVTFGVDIINRLQLLNLELGETLRIRVGINTGGPIVAWVLGIDKPTFDILGPAICLAALMEHHGVPMNVHIPQSTYDLIQSDRFIIAERGDVEVKGKIYHTYVVSGRRQVTLVCDTVAPDESE